MPSKSAHTPSATEKRHKFHDTENYAFQSDSSVDSDHEIEKSERVIGDVVSAKDSVKVVRLAWLQDSMSRGRVLDYKDYLVFEATKSAQKTAVPSPVDLRQRAKEMASASSQPSITRHAPSPQDRKRGHHIKTPALLPQSTTEEHAIAKLPPFPEILKTKFSCERPTFVHPTNEGFINKLKEVRELRAMVGDGVGVRAYSTAIATLSAYPYKLQSPLGERA